MEPQPPPLDLAKAMQEMKDDLRSRYLCESPQWVLNPWEYDFFKAHIDAGCEDDWHLQFFAQCVCVET